MMDGIPSRPFSRWTVLECVIVCGMRDDFGGRLYWKNRSYAPRSAREVAGGCPSQNVESAMLFKRHKRSTHDICDL